MPLPPKHRVPARGTQTGTMRPNDTLTIAGTERMRQGIYMYRKKFIQFTLNPSEHASWLPMRQYVSGVTTDTPADALVT